MGCDGAISFMIFSWYHIKKNVDMQEGDFMLWHVPFLLAVMGKSKTTIWITTINDYFKKMSACIYIYFNNQTKSNGDHRRE